MQVTRKGRAVTQEDVSICFYLPRPTAEVIENASLSLQEFLKTVGAGALNHFADAEGEWQELNESGWETVYKKFRNPKGSSVALTNDAPYPDKYEFEYKGHDIHGPLLRHYPGAVTAVRFILPMAWMKAHGPQRVRELALALAALLPFSSGHVGLSATGFLDFGNVMRDLVPLLVPYPGVDVQDLQMTAHHIGTRLRVPHWMTFIGEPALSEMGGTDFLRSQLHTPGTTVESLDASRAVVTLGPAPEPGGPDQPLPAYRELARVLEPWAFHPPNGPPGFPAATFQQWDRRFLD
ncbi:DUF3396 domain-containing protein [Corallococcus sp. bb12-1]|uniref:type VI immunity family protein n=1 Tax=Corallococcus sp. bb12-1 TaxID=2996784 RepID=UPI002270B6B4|nr:type VI immunity family protein [Corallococcus sp. bb12-1]MCY1047730.1 DUF3396 domain-containing protein [Corallococcus sp. bb12-1]